MVLNYRQKMKKILPVTIIMNYFEQVLPAHTGYHENRFGNVDISLIQCREYVVRRDGKTSLHTTALLPGKRSKWFLRYKTASRGKRKWSVLE